MRTIHDENYVRVVAHLREVRLRLGLTQEAVAARLGVHRTWVSKTETCERRIDFIETVDLCRLYRIELGNLARCIGLTQARSRVTRL